MDICLRVLKGSNKSRFDSYSVRNSPLLISHITFRDCRVHIFSDTFLEIAVYPSLMGQLISQVQCSGTRPFSSQQRLRTPSPPPHLFTFGALISQIFSALQVCLFLSHLLFYDLYCMFSYYHYHYNPSVIHSKGKKNKTEIQYCNKLYILCCRKST